MGPTLHTVVGESYILWFRTSNKYIVTNSLNFELVTLFLNVSNFDDFKNSQLLNGNSVEEIQLLYSTISDFLKECNTPLEQQELINTSFKNLYRNVIRNYKVGHLNIKICFSSDKLKSIIHPQLEHLESFGPITSDDYAFDIYIEDDYLFLFKNEELIGSYPVKDYHLLQGKFAMELLCAINNTTESDWIGTFHASTITDGNTSIMLIGDSGSGKSTFTALAMHYGYSLVADDFSPLLSKDQNIYCYPAGVSIKSGAFDMLDQIHSDFKNLKTHFVNPLKGYVKYLPPNHTSSFQKGFPCNTMLLVNYQENTKTELESITLDTALQILISESWISPKKKNAKQFLNWLKTLHCYRLTYSNNKEALKKLSDLF